jgi:hypothetical protein
LKASGNSTNNKILATALIFVTLLGCFFMTFQNTAYGAGGSLRVYSGLTGASVYIDGVYSGSTDSYSGATVNGLVAGNHALLLIMAGYNNWTKQVTIATSQTTTAYAYMELGSGVSETRNEIISFDSSLGSLKVYTGLGGVAVYVSNEYGGSTDSYSGATVNGLIAGTYSLKLSMAGYKDWSKQITITVGKTTTLYAYLETGTGASTTRNEIISYDSPFGILQINTGLYDANVNVYVGGEFSGTLDFGEATVHGLTNGIYTLRLTSTEYNDWTQQVTISTGQTTTIQPTLSPVPISSPTPTPTSTPKSTSTPTPMSTPTPKSTSTPTPKSTPTQITSNSPSHNSSSQSPELSTFTMLILFLVIGFVGLSLTTYVVRNRGSSLTIRINGQGTTKPPHRIQKYKKGTLATIEAIPNSGWEFDYWSGTASGKQILTTIKMDSSKAITANFIQIHILKISIVGQGTTSPPPGSHSVINGTSLEIKAIAKEGWTFDHWSGDLDGKYNPITLTMNTSGEITANFVIIAERTGRSNAADPYEILEVPRIALYNEVKDAWRKLSLIYHPDRCKDKDPVTQKLYAKKFDEINKAWEEIRRLRGWA